MGRDVRDLTLSMRARSALWPVLTSGRNGAAFSSTLNTFCGLTFMCCHSRNTYAHIQSSGSLCELASSPCPKHIVGVSVSNTSRLIHCTDQYCMQDTPIHQTLSTTHMKCSQPDIHGMLYSVQTLPTASDVRASAHRPPHTRRWAWSCVGGSRWILASTALSAALVTSGEKYTWATCGRGGVHRIHTPQTA